MSTRVSSKYTLISNIMTTSNYSSPTTTTVTTTPTTTSTTTTTTTSNSETLIPKLGEILNDEVEPKCIYSKINFMKFLVDKHCIENYDFYSELKSIINNYELFNRYNSTSEWFSIYNQFIETEIINLPADITLRLVKNKLPCIGLLNKIEKIILNYLLASYYEFISYNKYNLLEKNNLISFSTSIESSVNNTDYSCFTKLNNSLLSPDSNSMCSDFSFNFYQSDDEDECNNIKNDIVSTINKEVCYCNNEYFKIRNVKKENINKNIEKENEIDMNINKNITSSSCNDITLKSNQSSNSSCISNITVRDSNNYEDSLYESEKGGKSWSRFTKKLKWRRKSNSSSS